MGCLYHPTTPYLRHLGLGGGAEEGVEGGQEGLESHPGPAPMSWCWNALSGWSGPLLGFFGKLPGSEISHLQFSQCGGMWQLKIPPLVLKAVSSPSSKVCKRALPMYRNMAEGVPTLSAGPRACSVLLQLEAFLI